MRKEIESIITLALYLNGWYALAVREDDILISSDEKLYTVNHEEWKTLTVLSATRFSVSQGHILKML